MKGAHGFHATACQICSAEQQLLSLVRWGRPRPQALYDACNIMTLQHIFREYCAQMC